MAAHVIERCPFCGLEHGEPAGGACPACGTPLRAWCRRHGKETGWLDGRACPRCADEAARTPSRSRRAANAIPPASSPASRVEAGSQSAVGDVEPRGWRRSPWRLHYLLRLTLFLTCFGAAVGAALGFMGQGWGGDAWVFIEGGIIGGLFASVLGALTWLVERLFGRRK